MKEITLSGLKCIIKYPEKISQDEKNPLIIFLHGAGSRGDTTEKLVTNPFFVLTEDQKDLPFVVIAPLCSENTWFDMFEKLQNLITEVEKLSYVDKNRIYLMGASMGGYAAWQLAMIPWFSPKNPKKWLMGLINRVATQNLPSIPNVTTILGQTPTQIPRFSLGFWNTKRQMPLN